MSYAPVPMLREQLAAARMALLRAALEAAVMAVADT
jgi:hypothetical protein